MCLMMTRRPQPCAVLFVMQCNLRNCPLDNYHPIISAAQQQQQQLLLLLLPQAHDHRLQTPQTPCNIHGTTISTRRFLHRERGQMEWKQRLWCVGCCWWLAPKHLLFSNKSKGCCPLYPPQHVQTVAFLTQTVAVALHYLLHYIRHRQMITCASVRWR
jgi:hypothetical protein